MTRSATPLLPMALLAASQIGAAPLDFADSLKLPLPELAREVGDLFAENIVEAHRPTDGGNLLRLATRPRASGYYGLCEASWIDIGFHTAVDANGEVVSRDRAEYVSVRPVFRMVAPASPTFASDQQMDAADAFLAATCPQQKGVLDFFEAPDAMAASIAGQVVETLAAKAAGRSPLPFQVSCKDLQGSCDRARTGWSRLRASAMLQVKDGHCADLEYCVELSVAKNPSDLRGDTWIISAIVADADFEARRTDVVTYQTVRIKQLIVREAYSGRDLSF